MLLALFSGLCHPQILQSRCLSVPGCLAWWFHFSFPRDPCLISGPSLDPPPTHTHTSYPPSPPQALPVFLAIQKAYFFLLFFEKKLKNSEKKSRIFRKTPKIDLYCIWATLLDIADEYSKTAPLALFWGLPRQRTPFLPSKEASLASGQSMDPSFKTAAKAPLATP